MSVLLGSHRTNTVSDVNGRVRSITNDNQGQLYPDNSIGLLNAVRNAYNWLYGQIVRLQGQTFRVVLSDIPYTPSTAGQEQDLAGILPVDIYFPVKLEFRLNSGEEYVEVRRRQSLPPGTQTQPQRVQQWEFRGNTIFVIASQSTGQFKLTYMPLLGLVSSTSDPILINNSVEAIAHYAAYELFRARGQAMNAQMVLGDDGTRNGYIPTGAKGFAALVLDHLILNEQEIARRGQPFGNEEVSISYRDWVG